MRRIGLQPIIAVELRALDLHLSPIARNKGTPRRIAGPHRTLAAGLREKITVRRPDMAAAIDAERLTARIVDEVRTLAAATRDRHGVALRCRGVNVRPRRLLESNPLDARN